MLDQITITGADDNTNIEELLAMGRKYPFVEWGMLIARGETGDPKYPSLQWFADLVSARNASEAATKTKYNFSVHMCNDLVLELAETGSTEAFQPDSFGNVLSQFERVQLNFTRSIMSGKMDKNKLFQALAGRPQTFVFQLPNFDRENLQLVFEARKAGIKALPFFDLSSGRGILPESWPAPTVTKAPEEKSSSNLPPLVFGYSGGLGPRNVEEHLAKLHTIATNNQFDYWIDMETRVRTDNRFDLSKVETVLKIGSTYITSCVDLTALLQAAERARTNGGSKGGSDRLLSQLQSAEKQRTAGASKGGSDRLLSQLQSAENQRIAGQ